MTRTRAALGVGLALMAIAIAVTLTRSPPSVAWSNFTPLQGTLAHVSGGSRACQARQTLPRGASAVRLSLYAGLGPRVSVEVLSGGRVLTRGVRGAAWRGESPTVPLLPVSREVSDAKLCFKLGSSGENIALDGSAARPGEGMISQDGRSLGVVLRTEYIRPGNSSWFSSASAVARRIGLGRWPVGVSVALLAGMLVAAIVVGTAWLTARELR